MAKFDYATRPVAWTAQLNARSNGEPKAWVEAGGVLWVGVTTDTAMTLDAAASGDARWVDGGDPYGSPPFPGALQPHIGPAPAVQVTTG